MSNLFDQLRTQVQADLDAIHPGGILELGCQEYPGPLIIRRSMTVEGHGATIWALTGPVLIIEPGAKVQLKNLRVEVTGEEVTMSPAEEVAIDVRAGSDVDLDDVEVRGKIDGLAMEDAGYWRYPKTLYLGQVQSSSEHEFRVRIATTAACRISSEVTGLEVSPNVLPGGPVELRIKVDRLRNDTFLYGRVLLKTGLSKRWIVISGQVLDNPAQAATQGGPTMLWEPHDWATLLTTLVSPSIPSPSIPSPSIPSPSIPSPSIPSPSIPSPSIPSSSIPSSSIPSSSIPIPGLPTSSVPLTPVTERHSLRHQDPANLGIFAPKSSVPINTTSTPVSSPAAPSPPAAPSQPTAQAPWLNQPLNISPAPSLAIPASAPSAPAAVPTPPAPQPPLTPITISPAPPAVATNQPAKSPAIAKPLINSLFTRPLSTPIAPPPATPPPVKPPVSAEPPATSVAPQNIPPQPHETPVAKEAPLIPKWAQKSTPIVPPPN